MSTPSAPPFNESSPLVVFGVASMIQIRFFEPFCVFLVTIVTQRCKMLPYTNKSDFDSVFVCPLQAKRPFLCRC